MKLFLYCESQEGGMEQYELPGDVGPTFLRGWMVGHCKRQDQALMSWMAQAEVGTYCEHRSGVCIRLKDRA